MINVIVVQASICDLTGQEIWTYELTYPRVIHSQVMTHRMFSRNASSTRAVPIKVAIQNLMSDPAEYIWTANQSGMLGNVITDPKVITDVNALHEFHMSSAINLAQYMGKKVEDGGLGIHKQNVGRYLEPFQNIKVVLTTTEIINWEWLRDDEEAQGEIAELARAMIKAREGIVPQALDPGEWHVPYVERIRNQEGVLLYSDSQSVNLTVEEAKLVSASSCAQVSYRKNDTSLEKDLAIKDRLFSGRKVHASPVEHQATPIPEFEFDTITEWPLGVTHVDRNDVFWSGNFRNFIQHRQLIPNQNRTAEDG